MGVLLTTQGVTKRFGAVIAAEDVTFDIENGERFFLLGPSGCGKTTVLRCIAGLSWPTRTRTRSCGTGTSPRPWTNRRLPATSCA